VSNLHFTYLLSDCAPEVAADKYSLYSAKCMLALKIIIGYSYSWPSISIIHCSSPGIHQSRNTFTQQDICIKT